MLIISLATAGTVLTLNIHNKGNGDEPVPQIIQTIFFGYFSKLLLIYTDTNPLLDNSTKNICINLKTFYLRASMDKLLKLKASKQLASYNPGMN